MAIFEEQTGVSTTERAAGRPRMVSFVLPVYNEESSLEELHKQISAVMNGLSDDYELVFTAPANVSERLQQLAAHCGVGLTRIGRVIDGDAQPNAVMVRDTKGQCVEVGDGGYQHFHRRGPR